MDHGSDGRGADMEGWKGWYEVDPSYSNICMMSRVYGRQLRRRQREHRKDGMRLTHPTCNICMMSRVYGRQLRRRRSREAMV
jgi:hypothetical protein